MTDPFYNFGYSYVNSTNFFIASATNAATDGVTYTNAVTYSYDPTSSRLVTASNSAGFVRSNSYYTSGTWSNFLQSTVDVGFSTNTFTYERGNVSVRTNALGLVTTNTYDNLSRLVQISYPEGS